MQVPCRSRRMQVHDNAALEVSRGAANPAGSAKGLREDGGGNGHISTRGHRTSDGVDPDILREWWLDAAARYWYNSRPAGGVGPWR